MRGIGPSTESRAPNVYNTRAPNGVIFLLFGKFMHFKRYTQFYSKKVIQIDGLFYTYLFQQYDSKKDRKEPNDATLIMQKMPFNNLCI